MEGEDEASTDPAALENQGFWAKLLIFAAGAFMNFLTGLYHYFLPLCRSEGFHHAGDRQLCGRLPLAGGAAGGR